MARSRPVGGQNGRTTTRSRRVQVRIAEECLELDPGSPDDLDLLRRWVGRINGATYPQPYFVESPEGRFRLYVGEAAERVRTARGIA